MWQSQKDRMNRSFLSPNPHFRGTRFSNRVLHFAVSKGTSINQPLKDTKPEQVDEVIIYLNQHAKKRFRTDTQSTRSLITKLLERGYSIHEIEQVFDLKVAEWVSNKAMRPYLRPATLFDVHNFKKYLKESSLPTPKTIRA